MNIRLFLVGFLFLSVNSAQAFYAPLDNIFRESKSVVLETWADQIQVKVTETLINNSSERVTLQYLLPQTALAKPPQFFVDLNQKSLQSLDRVQASEWVFSTAKSSQNLNYFGLTEAQFSQWHLAENIILEAGETVELEFKWVQNADSFGKFYQSFLFTNDGIETGLFDLKLIREGASEIKHFIPAWESGGELLLEDKYLAWSWSAEDFVPTTNFRFFVSEANEAYLVYPHGEFVYRIDFGIRQKKEPQKVVIMLDQSGSMYGKKWTRTKSVLADIVRLWPESLEVRWILFDNEAEWWSDGYQKNTHAHQKFWQEQLSGIDPGGASDWALFNQTLRALSTNEERPDQILLVGDFNDFEFETLEKWENFDMPMVLLDFYSSEAERLDTWIKVLGGQRIVLFHSAFDFVEQKAFLNAWKAAGSVFDPQIPEGFGDRVVGKNFSVSRTLKKDQKSSLLADFVPGIWGQLKILEYINDYSLKGNSSVLEDVLALARIFNLKVVEHQASPQSLSTYLNTLEAQLWWDFVWSFEPFVFPNLLDGKPLYEAGNYLVQLGFESQDEEFKTIRIKPWSEAHKQLYLGLSDQLSGGFRQGNHVAFCSDVRCIVLEAHGRSEIQNSDWLYWNGESRDHWGYPYIEVLSSQNIFPLEATGDPQFAQVVTRGEFMQWLAEYHFGTDFITKIENPFTDLNSEDPYYKSVLWLHEKGIVNGFADGTVGPEKSLKRAEAIKILLALDGYEIQAIDILEDKWPFSDLVGWEKPWVLEAYRRGIVKGYEDGTFKPFNTLNRAEAAKIIVESKD